MRTRAAAGDAQHRCAGGLRRVDHREPGAGAGARCARREQQRCGGVADCAGHGALAARPLAGTRMAGNFNPRTAARALARRLAVQALYRWQLNAAPWQDLVTEFAGDADMPRADGEYFRALVQQAVEQSTALDVALTPFLARSTALLDPIEHAILLVASVELQHQSQVPYRVVIDEAVGLTRRFGATDGHKFVNAVLDRAARSWRADEH